MFIENVNRLVRISITLGLIWLSLLYSELYYT